MADLQTLVDHIHYENRRDYTLVKGDVAYLDGSPLTRPFNMPRMQRIIAAVIIFAAIVIGAVFINNTAVASLRETMQAEQTIANNLTREPSIETIPRMNELITLDDEEIRARLLESGYTIYDASDPNDPTSTILYKLPSDVSLDEAVILYAKGISNLTGIQASKLLNGSWYLATDRNGGTTMVVRYSDFSTGDPKRAVQNALSREGFDPASITDSGEDDSGNTYSSGTLDAGGTPCSWKISALPLSEMYSVKGLPEDACYVGVRVTVL